MVYITDLVALYENRIGMVSIDTDQVMTEAPRVNDFKPEN